MTTRYIHPLNRNQPIMLSISCSGTAGRGSRGRTADARTADARTADARTARPAPRRDAATQQMPRKLSSRSWPRRALVLFGQGALGLDIQDTMS
ncbi:MULTISPECIES: hypothetical protein [unclassified Streptomyces]|uniref:hypothetical protein n=1 Tax=unclassified Streptomyces TaxID=2593676 RepID=UPI002E2BA136|nr:hypothetical protein [Streptomyces sp. NBC_00273]